MDAFLSYSSGDKKLAERLRKELTKEGLSVWWDESTAPGEKWQQRIEKAIRSSESILVLVGDRVDEAQQFTWRVALEAVWKDSSKRLVPILLRGAELPAFVRSGTSGKVRAVQVENSRNVRSVSQAVLDLINGRTSQATEAVRIREFQRADNGRREALSAMASYVEHNLRTPPPKRGHGSDG
jgi:hypothetical protein